MARNRNPFWVPLMFGIISAIALIGRPSLAGVRAVDQLHLIGTGMCFGAAIPLLVMFLRDRK